MRIAILSAAIAACLPASRAGAEPPTAPERDRAELAGNSAAAPGVPEQALPSPPSQPTGGPVLRAPAGWVAGPYQDGGFVFTGPDGLSAILAIVQPGAIQQQRDQFRAGFSLGNGVYLSAAGPAIETPEGLWADFLVSGSSTAARASATARELPGGRILLLIGLAASGETDSLRGALAAILRSGTAPPPVAAEPPEGDNADEKEAKTADDPIPPQAGPPGLRPPR